MTNNNTEQKQRERREWVIWAAALYSIQLVLLISRGHIVSQTRFLKTVFRLPKIVNWLAFILSYLSVVLLGYQYINCSQLYLAMQHRWRIFIDAVLGSAMLNGNMPVNLSDCLLSLAWNCFHRLTHTHKHKQINSYHPHHNTHILNMKTNISAYRLTVM